MKKSEPFLAFDIETIPDIDGLREAHDIPGSVAAVEVHDFVCRLRRQQGLSDFLPLPFHKVAVVSCALLEDGGEKFRVFSLETCKEGEAQVVERFFGGIDKLTPKLLSWNGRGFDMPVLLYRGMRHGVVARTYWETGEGNQSFKWNNYVSRYHARHSDIMDLLSQYQPRSAAKLDTVAKQCGLPGKMGMDGGKVWSAWMDEAYDDIRFYCETDAVSTLLVGLDFERMRGTFGEKEFRMRQETVVNALRDLQDSRWTEYLSQMSRVAPKGH